MRYFGAPSLAIIQFACSVVAAPAATPGQWIKVEASDFSDFGCHAWLEKNDADNTHRSALDCSHMSMDATAKVLVKFADGQTPSLAGAVTSPKAALPSYSDPFSDPGPSIDYIQFVATVKMGPPPPAR